MRVMTFNLRYDCPDDGENRWIHRRELVIDTIRAADPDLLGTQECLALQGDFLRAQLSDYEMIGAYRDDGKRKGEASALFFKKDRFEHRESGTFWLSETPDAIGSRGWDADHPRVCSWAKLRNRHSSRELLFLNTHFDHRGKIARRESAKQLRSWIQSNHANLPTLITGDFNADGGSEPYRILCDDSFHDVWRLKHPTPITEEGTFHGWSGARTRERIDWILCSRHLDVIACQIDYATRAGRSPSDHFPVTADLHFAR